MTGADAHIAVAGEEKPLRLTLGALAEIEDAFGGDVEALGERLKRPRVADILLILRALLAGGGTAMTIEALKAADIDIAEAAAAVGKAFAALSEAPGKQEAARAGGTPSSSESSR